MKHWALFLPPILALTACNSSSVFPWIQPPAMEKAQGIVDHPQGQDTSELEARAAEERETLPTPPTPPDPDTYSTIGTVPPRPDMPSIAEIAGEANALDAEQKAAMARIALQAGAPLPETLPKPNAGGTIAAVPTESQTGTQSPRAPVMATVGTMTLSGDNSALMPQSQTVESTDLMPSQDR